MPAGNKKDASIKVLLQFQADNSSLGNATRGISTQLTQLQKRTARVGQAMTSMVPAFGAVGAGAFAAFSFAAKAAVQFEDSFAGIKKTVNFTGRAVANSDKNFERLSQSIIDLSKNTPIAVNELNRIGEIGGQLGITAANMTSFIDTISKLTVATTMSAEDASFALARLGAVTRTPEENLDNLASVLVRLGNEFAATESEISQTAIRIASAMELLESPISNAGADALALSASLKAVGQQSQSGATAVARALDIMSQAVTAGGRELSLFAKLSDMTQAEFQQLAEIDPARAFLAFIRGLEQVGNAGGQTAQILDELGLGQQRTLRALRSLALASDDMERALSMANEEFTANNALQSEAEKRFETVNSQIGILKNNVTALGVAYGNELLPQVNSVVQGFTNFVDIQETGVLESLFKTVAAVALLAQGLRSARKVAESFQMEMAIEGTGLGGKIRTRGDIFSGKEQKQAQRLANQIREGGLPNVEFGQSTMEALMASEGMNVSASRNLVNNLKIEGIDIFDQKANDDLRERIDLMKQQGLTQDEINGKISETDKLRLQGQEDYVNLIKSEIPEYEKIEGIKQRQNQINERTAEIQKIIKTENQKTAVSLGNQREQASRLKNRFDDLTKGIDLDKTGLKALEGEDIKDNVLVNLKDTIDGEGGLNKNIEDLTENFSSVAGASDDLGKNTKKLNKDLNVLNKVSKSTTKTSKELSAGFSKFEDMRVSGGFKKDLKSIELTLNKVDDILGKDDFSKTAQTGAFTLGKDGTKILSDTFGKDAAEVLKPIVELRKQLDNQLKEITKRRNDIQKTLLDQRGLVESNLIKDFELQGFGREQAQGMAKRESDLMFGPATTALQDLDDGLSEFGKGAVDHSMVGDLSKELDDLKVAATGAENELKNIIGTDTELVESVDKVSKAFENESIAVKDFGDDTKNSAKSSRQALRTVAGQLKSNAFEITKNKNANRLLELQNKKTDLSFHKLRIAMRKTNVVASKGAQVVMSVGKTMKMLLLPTRKATLELQAFNATLQNSTVFSDNFKRAAGGMITKIAGAKAAMNGFVVAVGGMVALQAVFTLFTKFTAELAKTKQAVDAVAESYQSFIDIDQDIEVSELKLAELFKIRDEELAKSNPNAELLKAVNQRIKDEEKALAAAGVKQQEAIQEFGNQLLFDTTSKSNVDERMEALAEFFEVDPELFKAKLNEKLGEQVIDFQNATSESILNTLFDVGLTDSAGNVVDVIAQDTEDFFNLVIDKYGEGLEGGVAKLNEGLGLNALADSFVVNVASGGKDPFDGIRKMIESGANLTLEELENGDIVLTNKLAQINQTFTIAGTEIQTSAHNYAQNMYGISQDLIDETIATFDRSELEKLGFNVDDLLSDDNMEKLHEFTATLVGLETIRRQARGKGSGIFDRDEIGEMSTFIRVQNEALREQARYLKMQGVLAEDVDVINNRGKAIVAITAAEEVLFQQRLAEAQALRQELELEEFQLTALQKALKKSLQSAADQALSLFSDMPQKMKKSIAQIVEEMTIKEVQVRDFESQIKKLAASFPFLAAELAKTGPAAIDQVTGFLNDMTAALSVESTLMRGREQGAVDLGISQEEIDQAKKQGLQIGQASADGILIGLQNRKTQLQTVFVSVMKDAVDVVKQWLQENSPSRRLRDQVGKPMVDGIIVGIEDKEKELHTQAVDTTEVAVEGILDTLDEGRSFIKNEIDDIFLMMTHQQATSELEQAFNAYQNFRDVFRGLNEAAFAQQKAEQNLMRTRREQAKFAEDFLKLQQELQKMEVLGRKGNVIASEELNILKQKLALEEMRRKERQQFTATEKLAIQNAKEEFEKLELAAEAGIVSGLEVEAAQERLDELTGNNKSKDEQRIAVLELAEAERRYNETVQEAKETDKDLVRLREQNAQAIDTLANKSFELQGAYNQLERAIEGTVKADLNYEKTRKEFSDFVDKSPQLFGQLMDAYGGVDSSIGTLITSTVSLADTTETQMARAIKSVREFTTELIIARQTEADLQAFGGDTTMDPDNAVYQDVFKKRGTAEEVLAAQKLTSAGSPFAKLLNDAIASGQTAFMRKPGLATDKNVFANQNEADSTRAQTEAMLRDLQDPNISREYNVAQVAKFIEGMLGIPVVIDSSGNMAFNADSLRGLGMSDDQIDMLNRNFGNTAGLANINVLEGEQSSFVTSTKEKDYSSAEGEKRGGGGASNYKYNANPTSISSFLNFLKNSGQLIGGQASNLNSIYDLIDASNMSRQTYADAVAGKGRFADNAIRDQYLQTLQNNFNRVLKPFMGGNNLVLKGYKYGGLMKPFQRALVGEYGPEMVTATPNGGLRVQPQYGESGASINVENVNVNVTGVPSDPMQARKAAIQIQNALVKLGKEGSYGGGLRRA